MEDKLLHVLILYVLNVVTLKKIKALLTYLLYLSQ